MTGSVPGALGNLLNLREVNLSYSWGVAGPLPHGLRLPRLEKLNIGATRACAPAAWREWLETVDFLGNLCGAGPDFTIDLAVVYTPAVREAAGGAAAIQTVIDLWVAEANEAFTASGVNHRLALVDRSEVAYDETDSIGLDSSRFPEFVGRLHGRSTPPARSGRGRPRALGGQRRRRLLRHRVGIGRFRPHPVRLRCPDFHA